MYSIDSVKLSKKKKLLVWLTRGGGGGGEGMGRRRHTLELVMGCATRDSQMGPMTIGLPLHILFFCKSEFEKEFASCDPYQNCWNSVKIVDLQPSIYLKIWNFSENTIINSCLCVSLQLLAVNYFAFSWSARVGEKVNFNIVTPQASHTGDS